MARSPDSPILAQLRAANTYQDQTAALRALKNEIVGHIQKKEAWISLGVLEPIVRTLSTDPSPNEHNNRDVRLLSSAVPLSDEDDVKLQALQLVASFANGGPSFLQPLHAARLLPAILANISPFTNPPQIVLAALRALNDITNASAFASPSSPLSLHDIADSLFLPPHTESLNAILSITSSKHSLQSQVTIAALLISRLCQEERHQNLLTAAGILDSLAARLASFVVSGGYVIPGADVWAQKDSLSEVFPDVAPRGAKLGPLLEAIGAVLGDSKYRANRFVYNPVMLAVFPSIKFDGSRNFQDGKPDTEYAAVVNTYSPDSTAMDYLLPSMPLAARAGSVSQPATSGTDRPDFQRGQSFSGKTSASSFWGSTRSQSQSHGGDNDLDHVESPLIPWLIHLVRTRAGYERLMAASLLTTLFKAGFGNKAPRETSLGLLVVPILVEMIAHNDKNETGEDEADAVVQRLVLEKAPAILARLIADSQPLQKAAFDAGAAKVLAKLLKHAYVPVPPQQQRFWSPQPDADMHVEGTSPVSRLGETGQNPLLVHRVRVREAALKAIGALAAGEEDYRRALAAEDFIHYLYESLKEFPRKPRQPKERPKEQRNDDAVRSEPTPGYGVNPVSVLIAACYVVRILARSVGILRTELVDHSVALPILKFMRHRDVNVQIAATTTMINLVLEVSPVRELLAENGVMAVLCEHAHSDNPALRLSALWALKHFVDTVNPAIRKACLEKLEPGWLVRLVSDDKQDLALFSTRPVDSFDEDMEPQLLDEPIRWLYGSNGNLRELDASRSTRLRQVEDRLTAVRESELNPVRRACNDDLAIQEQGLDFIRNFIGRPTPGLASESTDETSEMIDHLFNEVGQDRVFEILASKLRPRILPPFSRQSSGAGRERRMLYPQHRLVVAVIFVLVHMAAGGSRHRQLVITQTELLKLLVQQASSPEREVRVALCHLIINLTWRDDDGELQACSQRAHELRRWGFHTKMETMKDQDRDLDVRERAKTAVWQIEQASF
ncbi:hypothetical protein S40293_07533 [Stachybotrys chartarum IBT 40293]|nr:hypothetical protein S40293_07533 [Stachybotrys chartarum IBT 40293]